MPICIINCIIICLCVSNDDSESVFKNKAGWTALPQTEMVDLRKYRNQRLNEGQVNNHGQNERMSIRNNRNWLTQAERDKDRKRNRDRQRRRREEERAE